MVKWIYGGEGKVNLDLSLGEEWDIQKKRLQGSDGSAELWSNT